MRFSNGEISFLTKNKQFIVNNSYTEPHSRTEISRVHAIGHTCTVTYIQKKVLCTRQKNDPMTDPATKKKCWLNVCLFS